MEKSPLDQLGDQSVLSVGLPSIESLFCSQRSMRCARVFLLAILSTVFRANENIQPILELPSPPFGIVIVRSIQSNDPTTAPTMAPTGTASENPTPGPTTTLSSSPTIAPVVGVVAPFLDVSLFSLLRRVLLHLTKL